MKNIVKTAIKKICVKASELACGTASANYICQPKEPKIVQKFFEKK